MAESIATAYVTIRPDSSRFRDELRADLAGVSEKETVRVDADTAGAQAKLLALKAATDSAAGSSGGGGFGALKMAGLGAASALMPVGTVVTGLAVGLAGLGVAAGVGMGALALAAKPMITSINAASTAQMHYNNVVAQYGVHSTQAKTAAGQLGMAMSQLSPAERSAAENLTTFKNNYQSWAASFDPQILPVFSQGLHVATQAMGALSPVVRGAAQGMSGLLGQFQMMLPTIAGPLATIGSSLGGLLTGVGGVLANLIEGLMHFAQAAMPLVNIVLGILLRFTSMFATLNFAKILDPLAASFQRLAPIVGKFLESVLELVFTLLKALAPVGVALFQVISSAVTALLPVIRGLGQVLNAIAPVVAMVAQVLASALGGAIRAIAPIISALLPIIRDFVTLIGGQLAKDIQAVAPAFDALAKTIAAFFTAFGSALGPAAAGITKFLADVSPLTFVFTPVAKAIAALTPLFTELGSVLGRLIGPVLSIVGAFLSAAGTVIGALVPALGTVVQALVSALLPVLSALDPIIGRVAGLIGSVLADAIKVLAPVIVKLAPVVGQLASTLGSLLVAALTALLPVVAALLPPLMKVASAILTALLPILPVLVNALHVLLPPITKIILAIGGGLISVVKAIAPLILVLVREGLVPLLSALLPLLPTLVGLVAALLPILPPIIQLIGLLLRELMPLILPLVGLLTELAAFLIRILVTAIDAVVQAITWLLTNWRTVWDAIRSVAETVWGWIGDAWHTLWAGFKTAWDDVSNFFTGAWNKFTGLVERIWGSTKSGSGIVGFIASAWHDLTSLPKEIWHDIESGFAAGANAVIRVVNDFINGVKRILSDLGLGSLAGHLGDIGLVAVGGYASGGSLPASAVGSGFRTSGPRAIVGEGNPSHPEYVIPTDPAYRGRATSLTSSLLTDLGWPGLAVGALLGGGSGAAAGTDLNALGTIAPGTFGSLPTGGGGGGGGILGTIGRLASGALHAITGAAVDAVLDPFQHLLDAAAGGMPGALGSMAKGLVDTTFRGVKAFLEGKAKAAGRGGPLPSGAHASLVRQALGIAGVPDSAGNEGAVNTIVTHESGWNPNAINLWDINAKNGDPSRGLMQTIATTFEAYRARTLPDDIFNPLANLVAGIRYAVSNYGSLTNVPGVVSVARGGSYVGYAGGGVLPVQTLDQGGWLPPGLSAVFNGTGMPERVPGPRGADSHDVLAALGALIAEQRRTSAALESMPKAVALLKRTGAL